MKVQFNTDKNIQGTEMLEAFVADKISSSLKHFADKITRIEVHLSDQNADKVGKDDIQCKIEARIAKLKPIIATSNSDTKEKALDMAIDKMKAALNTIIGKMKNK
jgi:ribosome-associated translation inhibitor RaiA